MTGRVPYLPALDGLRAIAVTAVVCYHLGIGWSIGGFLGVDLFFVISGFLITTLLLGEHDDTGRIALGSFWVRRFKRLVPPLVVLVAATVAATRLWGLPEQWASIRWDAAAALGYVGNWRFVVADQSYFQALLGPSPLRHTWSLAVEEQWYLVWPLAMVGLAAVLRRRRGHVVALGLIGFAAIGSAVLMAALYVADDPSRVYYGTDTRAQQLLVGAALGVVLHRWPTLAQFGARPAGASVALIALMGFLAVVAVVPDDAPALYRGGFLAVSLLCAVIVAATATPRVAAPLRWLEWAPLTWIGVRSYSIYLWHWPVILFVGTPMGIDLTGATLMALQLAVTLVLADLSHRWIERPVRRTTWRPVAVLGTWSAASVAAAIIAVAVLATPEGRELSTAEAISPEGMVRPTDDPAAAAAADTAATGRIGADDRRRPAIAPDTATPDAATATVPASAPARPPTALVIGDSMAFRLMVEKDLGDQFGWDLFGSARTGCGFVEGEPVDADSSTPVTRPPECAAWRQEFAEAVEWVRPDVTVVMMGAWEVLDHRIAGIDVRFPDPAWYEAVRRAVDEVVSIAASTGAHVIPLTLPCMEASADQDTTARTDVARVDAFNTILRDVDQARADVTVFELGDVLCPDGAFLAEHDGEVIRYDGVHLTTAGANYVWQLLRPEMARHR
jgi:peptidoglycan/LPS O-acetylase OafA/YrhL